MFPFGQIYPADRALLDQMEDTSLVLLVPKKRSLSLCQFSLLTVECKENSTASARGQKVSSG